MRPFVASALALALSLAAVAARADLDRPGEVDRVFVHPQTRQAALSLMANQPLDDPGIAQKMAIKTATYARYRDSGRLYVEHPEVDRALPVVVSVTIMVPPESVIAQELLAATRKALERRAFEVWLNVYDPVSRKLRRR